MDEKKLQELMNDEEFVKQMAELKTAEEVQVAFKAKGVEISVDEIKKLGEEGKTALEDGSLENVSGGGFGDIWYQYKEGLTTLPTTSYEGISAWDEQNPANKYTTGEKVALYAGNATPWALGAGVCAGLIYGGIKTGAFKKGYEKAQDVYGKAKDKIGGWMSSKEVK